MCLVGVWNTFDLAVASRLDGSHGPPLLSPHPVDDVSLPDSPDAHQVSRSAYSDTIARVTHPLISILSLSDRRE